MVKHFLQSLGLVLLLLTGYGLTLLPLLFVHPHVEAHLFMGAMFIWFLLFALSLPFFLRIIIHRVWFFTGQGEPIVKDLLESMLLGVNDYNTPVIVRKKRSRLIITWRCSDPRWCELMAAAGLRKTYELTLYFNYNTRTVTMKDRVRRVNFDLCPIKVKIGFLASPRFYCRVGTGSEWRLMNFKNIPADHYQFRPWELKSPVFNTIINNGWNVRFTLF